MTEIVRIAKKEGSAADEQVLMFAGYALLGMYESKFCVHLTPQQTLDGCQALTHASVKCSPTGSGGADLHSGLQSGGQMYLQMRLGSLWAYAKIVMTYQYPAVLVASAVLVMGEGGCYVQETALLCESNCSF
jgi:hypothetical protein